MEQRAHKLSVLGDWRSGRSSVVAVLSGKPCPNHPGIQVTRWTEPHSGRLLEVWDVNSRTALEPLGQIFISGSEGLVAVADATRPDSIVAAVQSVRAARAVLGERPALLLLNKSDLPGAADGLAQADLQAEVRCVSARKGEGVLEAFRWLADRLSPP